jgi:hypothetical protein
MYRLIQGFEQVETFLHFFVKGIFPAQQNFTEEYHGGNLTYQWQGMPHRGTARRAPTSGCDISLTR